VPVLKYKAHKTEMNSQKLVWEDGENCQELKVTICSDLSWIFAASIIAMAISRVIKKQELNLFMLYLLDINAELDNMVVFIQLGAIGSHGGRYSDLPCS
jgi:hypothetical protein